MPPRGSFSCPGRGWRAGGRQRAPGGTALLLPLLAAAAAGLSLQPGRVRNPGVCPNQLNPNLWVDAQSTCERECQADQVSGGCGAGGARGRGSEGHPQVPRGRRFGVQVPCPVPLFRCDALSLAAASPPGAPAVRRHKGCPGPLPGPQQAKKLLVAPMSHAGPCPVARTPALCTPRMLPPSQGAGTRGTGVLGQGPPSGSGQPPLAPRP